MGFPKVIGSFGMPFRISSFLSRFLARRHGPRGAGEWPDLSDRPARDNALSQPLPDTPGLLARMMSAHGVATAQFALHHPVQVRRMIRTCSACTCQQRCQIDLDRGVARATAAEYCPNCDQFC